jgi:NAD(P)-dependent dehydrogenase (short-subunit alcohol dehydrogenase family)
VARYAAAVAEKWGGLDCFFNNAGILGAVRPLVDYPEEVFDRVLAVNVKGVWLGLKTVAPLLRARGGAPSSTPPPSRACAARATWWPTPPASTR